MAIESLPRPGFYGDFSINISGIIFFSPTPSSVSWTNYRTSANLCLVSELWQHRGSPPVLSDILVQSQTPRRGHSGLRASAFAVPSAQNALPSKASYSNLCFLIQASFHQGKLPLFSHHPSCQVCIIHSHGPGISSLWYLFQLLLCELFAGLSATSNYTVSSMRAEIVFSLLCSQHPIQGLAHSRCSINIC